MIDQIREIVSALSSPEEYNFFQRRFLAKIFQHSPSDIKIKEIRNEFLENMGTLRDVIRGPYFTLRLTAQENTHLVDDRSFFATAYIFLWEGLHLFLLV